MPAASPGQGVSEERRARDTKAATWRRAEAAEAAKPINTYPEGGRVEAKMEWLRSEVRRRRITQGLLLSSMDTDKSARVTRLEFKRGLEALDIDLPDPQDYYALFKAIDVDRSNGITKPEIARAVFGVEVKSAIRDLFSIMPPHSEHATV